MRRTKSGLPRFCGWNLDRINGKRRVRFRKGAISRYLTGTPWGEEFMRQYAAALDDSRGENIGAARSIPGSFDALCVAYYRSPEFLALKPITQGDRKRIVERLRADYGKLPVARIERRHIKALMARLADTPQAANNLLKVLRILLNTAVDFEMIAANPAVGIKRYKQIGDGFPTWRVAQFRAAHAIGTKPRLALELLLGSGQRRSDVVRFGWQHVDGEDLVLRQSKTGTPLRIPIAPELARSARLDPMRQPDIPARRSRQIIRRTGVRHVVPPPLYRGRPRRPLGSWLAQARGNTAGQRGMLDRSDQGDHRASVARGRPLYGRPRSGEARPRGRAHAARRSGTERHADCPAIVQHREEVVVLRAYLFKAQVLGGLHHQYVRI